MDFCKNIVWISKYVESCLSEISSTRKIQSLPWVEYILQINNSWEPIMNLPTVCFDSVRLQVYSAEVNNISSAQNFSDLNPWIKKLFVSFFGQRIKLISVG